MTNIGKYTIRQGLRPDNPAWPVFLIYVGERLIGKQLSMPSLTDCQFLERQVDPTDLAYVKQEKDYGRHYRVKREYLRYCRRCTSPYVPKRDDNDYCHACSAAKAA